MMQFASNNYGNNRIRMNRSHLILVSHISIMYFSKLVSY